MAIETAEDTASPELQQLTKPSNDSATKPAGLLERATEIFMISGFSLVAFFLYTEDLDLTKQLLFVGLFVVLSLIGGVLTNVKPSTS